MTNNDIKGLNRSKQIYEDRYNIINDYTGSGNKVIGYLCIYPVTELLTALDLIPYRIFGDIKEPITKADSCLPTIVCPFLRSLVDLGLKGKYDFLSGVVMAHICEVGEKTHHLWKTYLDTEYTFFIDTPHTVHKAAIEHHKNILNNFKKSLEEYTGKELTDDKLIEAVKIHNEQRKLVKELYDLRKPETPLLTGAETLQVLMAIMSIPVSDGNELLKDVIAEVKSRKDVPPKKSKRLLIWGSVIDNIALYEMIEELDADVVVDDTCVGTRMFFDDVEATEDPMDGLAHRYLADLKCPRTFKEAQFGETTRDYKKDIDNRFGYIGRYAKDWNVDGVILHSLRYCDIHGYDTPSLKDYLDSIGIKSIYIEPDYTESALAQLRTRIEAFIETLEL